MQLHASSTLERDEIFRTESYWDSFSRMHREIIFDGPPLMEVETEDRHRLAQNVGGDAIPSNRKQFSQANSLALANCTLVNFFFNKVGQVLTSTDIDDAIRSDLHPKRYEPLF